MPLVGCTDDNGEGGTGGLCTNAEDTAVFDMLEYTDDNDAMSTGTDAATNLAGDCLFGAPPRCGAELADVIVDNNAENSAALAGCVVACMSMQADLTPDCLSCYGDIVACGAVNCVAECASDAFHPDCLTCRIDNNCDSDFFECSGLEGPVPGMLSVTVTDATGFEDFSGPPLEGVELCETDTTNCAMTDADGLASITLPTDQEVSYTLSKEGYVPYLVGDVTDALFTASTPWPMISDQLAEDFSMTGSFPYPWTGGAIIVAAFPLRAGVTYDLVGETPMAFYTEDGSPNFDLTATTSDGTGGFVEVPTGEYQVDFGGTATNCTPRTAWPGDAPNRIRVPVRVGYFTFSSMWCDAP